MYQYGTISSMQAIVSLPISEINRHRFFIASMICLGIRVFFIIFSCDSCPLFLLLLFHYLFQLVILLAKNLTFYTFDVPGGSYLQLKLLAILILSNLIGNIRLLFLRILEYLLICSPILLDHKLVLQILLKDCPLLIHS